MHSMLPLTLTVTAELVTVTLQRRYLQAPLRDRCGLATALALWNLRPFPARTPS